MEPNKMEPKVVGPLTFKQFVYVSLGASLSFAIYFSLGRENMFLALILIAVVEFMSCVMAFVKK